MSSADGHSPNSRSAVRRFLALYRLRQDDMELARAQFAEFQQQIPLLYLILASGGAAVSISFLDIGRPLLTVLFPSLLCGVSFVRGVWWYRRRNAYFTDAEIRRHIRTTSLLALVIAVAFMAWGFLLYHQGDTEMRGHLVFFLALTQIACVFLLMPVRAAALGVATIGVVPFLLHFLIVDNHRMWVEALVQALVGFGMVVTLLRYNRSFAALIQSQRTLHNKHSETQRLSDENRRVALTDTLSGLPNRRALLARLDALAAAPLAGMDGTAIVFIDLDGFKGVNDGHGHQFGDNLLAVVARLLAGDCPDGALLTRMGGDEFAVLLQCPRATDAAHAFAARVLERLAQPLMVEGRAVHIGASIGIASNSDDAVDPYELLRRADTAMYHIKERGKNGCQIYHAAFDADRLRRQAIAREIEAGLAADEFAVVYQPLVDTTSKRCVAVEALVRWPGRGAGALAPDDFIEIAELGGLIQRLGLFVLRQACGALRDVPDCKLSVNISPAQFRHTGFEEEVVQVLRETGFPPDRLQLEITEKHLIDHPDRAAKAIDALRALGVTFALDDFGTGFTSIAYLRSYGFDCIKIDRSLSRDLGRDAKAALLITGMVHIANALDMQVVAEGVETEAQAALLDVAGCHILQGYLFGRPAPITTLDRTPFALRAA